ncbi:MAG TPA: universal stress protein [Xanthobacteraceae bacterium]|nr:universal stress protein [Xanthobacteraceae bacterium]
MRRARSTLFGEESMIKDIVTNLSLRNSRDVAMDFAVSTAAAFDAHLAGIAFVYEPIIPAMVDMYGMPPEVIESQRVENENMAKAALGRFEDAARGAALSAEPRMVDAQVATAPGRFADIARRFDLSVLGQPEPDQPTLDRLMIEAALFDTGRPMLVVPYIQRTGLKLDHIMLAWDGSRSAARAAGDALPFIRRGKLVEIVIVASDGAKSDEMPGADIAQHLARHGAKVELNRIVTTETDVANTILSHAADSSADFLVMGGYGHSRLREFILGGVTREILTSMTIPTLMSH